MNELKALVILELRSLFGINKALHIKDKKAKNNCILLSCVWALLIVMALSYVSGQVAALCYLGLSALVPAFLVYISTLIIIAVGIFKAGKELFGREGLDIILSMPVPTRAVVLSRFALMYVENLLITLVIMLPGAVTYGVICRPSAAFYVLMPICTIFVPLVPMSVNAFVGVLLEGISARMKNKSLVQTALMLALVVGTLALSFNAEGLEDLTPEYISQLVEKISESLGSFYPLAVWLGNAVLKLDILSLALFALVSVFTAVLCITLCILLFKRIVYALSDISAKHDYKLESLESRGAFKALYLRELKRYFSSSIYASNTLAGPIMACIASVALIFADTDALLGAAAVDININRFAPFLLSAMLCMMSPTFSSVSIEGKQFWAVKSLPISPKDLFDAKIALSLSLTAPSCLVSAVCLSIALRPSLTELLAFLFVPVVMMLYSAVMGLCVNIKFHRFDWENEAEVVKQGTSAMIGTFSAFLTSLVCAGVLLLVPDRFAFFAQVLLCLILLFITRAMYAANNKVKLEDL